MLPAAGFFDGLAPPHASGAIEIKEDVAARTSTMLKDEMPVEQNGLNFRQERIVSIQVRPACLHHTDRRIGKVVHHTQEPVLRRHKVRVEDSNELALCGEHSILKCSGLKTFAIGAMNI